MVFDEVLKFVTKKLGHPSGVCMYIYIYIYICVCVCVCVYVCV